MAPRRSQGGGGSGAVLVGEVPHGATVVGDPTRHTGSSGNERLDGFRPSADRRPLIGEPMTEINVHQETTRDPSRRGAFAPVSVLGVARTRTPITEEKPMTRIDLSVVIPAYNE